MSSYSHQVLDHFDRGLVNRYLFNNGAVFLHHRLSAMRGACFYIWFLAGSRNESPEQSGICHLLEHMIFRTRGASGKRLAQEIENEGGIINACTTKEYTCFELEGVNRDLPQIVPSFLEMVLRPQFEEADFAREKQIVIQEIKEDRDSHEYLVEEQLFEDVFPPDLGHAIAGQVSDVRKLKLDQAQKFFKTYFRPERMVISYVGDDGAENYLPLIEGAFEKLSWTKSLKAKRPVLKTRSTAVLKKTRLIKKPSELAIIQMATMGTPLEGSERYALSLLDAHLTDGMSSQLFKRLRDELGLIYSAAGDLNCFTDRGCYSIQVSCAPENRQKIKKIMLEEIERLAENGIESLVLDRHKKHLLDYWDLLLDSYDLRNAYLSRGELYRSRFMSLQELGQNLQAVTSQDIAKFASKILESDISYVELIPLKEKRNAG